MKLAEIRRALDEGLRVHWQTIDYEVIRSTGSSDCFIRCVLNGHCIGLTHADGVTLNGKEEDFFIEEPLLR
jgi:hypothetical protein